MWNKELETISRKDLEALQLKKLKAALAAAEKTPYYRKILKDNNINADSFTTLDRLKDLPFTSKDDLRLSYPDGMVAVPRSEIVRLHASSGTTGKSTVIFYTHEGHRRLGRPARALHDGHRRHARRRVPEHDGLRAFHRRPGPPLRRRAARAAWSSRRPRATA